MSENTRDRDLAARLVSGDEAALREVYREHVAAMNGLALRVLSNEALAEEVVQDVFVRLWEQPERFDADRGRMRAFLLSMATAARSSACDSKSRCGAGTLRPGASRSRLPTIPRW